MDLDSPSSTAVQEDIPEDILRPLFSAANTADLRQSLLSLTHLCKQNPEAVSSFPLFSPVLSLVSLLPASSPHLSLSLSLLRNLCAISPPNQLSFLSLNGPKTLYKTINALLLESTEACHGVVRIGLQVLGNVSLGGGEECQRGVWSEFFPGGFVEIGRIRRKEICDVLCMVVYVCSDGVEEIGVQLRGDKGMNLMVEIIRTTTEAGYKEDWFRLLVSRLCVEEFYLPSLFTKLYLDDVSGDLENINFSDKIFSTEQVFLLRTVSEILNERLKEVTVTTDFAVWLWGIFKRAVHAVDFFTKSSYGLPTGLDAVDILGYSLTILRDICAQGGSSNEGSTDVVDQLVSSGLMEFLLSLLRDLEPPSTIRKAMKNDVQVSSNASSLKLCPYKGFRRDIVGVIGNCAFGRKHVQDEIREKKGILLLLQQCVIDEENPFLREWGIWSVRNLLEGNIENQKEVAELELQESVDVPELAGLGIRVEVDKNTRRAKLVNVS